MVSWIPNVKLSKIPQKLGALGILGAHQRKPCMNPTGSETEAEGGLLTCRSTDLKKSKWSKIARKPLLLFCLFGIVSRSGRIWRGTIWFGRRNFNESRVWKQDSAGALWVPRKRPAASDGALQCQNRILKLLLVGIGLPGRNWYWATPG